jgi:hypothetical protein
MKRISFTILLAVALLGASVIVSLAGVKTIKPNQLEPEETSQNYKQTADYLTAADDTAIVYFTCEVKLPVGKNIKKITLYHQGSGTFASTQVYLFRTKMGEERQTVGLASSINTSNTTIAVDGNVLIPRINSGYTYWLSVSIYNSTSIFKGLKIYY